MRALLIGLCTLIPFSSLYAIEILHTPPHMRESLGVLTLEVKAPEAEAVRLISIKAGKELTAYNLRAESGVFRIRVVGRELIGHKYNFQIRTKSGHVFESSPYMITDDAIIADKDELLNARLEIDVLDRRIATQRRTLAALRQQAKIISPGDDQIRRQAQELLQDSNQPVTNNKEVR